MFSCVTADVGLGDRWIGKDEASDLIEWVWRLRGGWPHVNHLLPGAIKLWRVVHLKENRSGMEKLEHSE